MKKPVIAVVSFPGNNCEVESSRAIAASGMDPVPFRWNDDRSALQDVDGYFLVGGFSYEDRGRSGMVAARDRLMDFIGQEAERGKVVIGNCNGAQVLVESGLIPLDRGLRMSLAHNAIHTPDGYASTGFLSQWVWITTTCSADRCATSDWHGAMHLPIAHGEGRFVTEDKDVIAALKANDQIAFSYCDAAGTVSDDPAVTPNGSLFSAAGICNPAGNVIALMPHPERTSNGKPYFDSMKRWIERSVSHAHVTQRKEASATTTIALPTKEASGTEIFIASIIVNNEERTVEQTARMFAPSLRLKQWKYLRTEEKSPRDILADLAIYNANKERAYVRRGSTLSHWNGNEKREEPLTALEAANVLGGIALLRRDIPDTGAGALGRGGESGVCYVVSDVEADQLRSRPLLEVFGNPHASTLHILS